MTDTAIQKENKRVLWWMTLVALLFAFTVTKNIAFPKIFLYAGMAAGAMVLAAASLKKPEWATYVFVVYLPFSRVLAGDFDGLAQALNLTNVFMIFILWAWFAGKYAEGESKWVSSALNIPMILFLILGLISVVRGAHAWSGSLLPGLIDYKRWFTPFFLYFLVLNTVKEKNMVHNVIKIMMIVTTIVGLMAMYDYVNNSGSSIEKMRVGGICDQPNQMAGFFVFYMFLPFGLFLMNISKAKYWLLIIPFLIQFRGIMVTFSRGGYLGFAAGLFGIVFWRSKILSILLCLISILVYFNPVLLPGGIRYRMAQTVEKPDSFLEGSGNLEDNLESSSATRIEIWKAAIEMIKDYPYLGVGYGLFEDRLQFYWDGGKKDAHNQYIIIAAEMGIFALLVFLLLLFMMWKNAYVLYKTALDPFSKAVGLGMMGGISGLLMNNMFGSRLNSQEVSAYLWILAALVVRLLVIEKSKPSDTSTAIEAGKSIRRETLDACWFEEDKNRLSGN